MAFELFPVQESEQHDLIQFLTETLQSDFNLTSFHPDVVHWKYFTRHPEWRGPRTLAVKQHGRIVAHGGVWPVWLLSARSEISVVHLIDWAASRASVGAGVFLLRKMASCADVLLTIGGSRDTRSLLPKLGYRHCGELRYYARVVRPWLLFRTTPQQNWKTPLKLLRDSMRIVTSPLAQPEGWQAVQVSKFPDELQEIVGGKPTSTSSVRTAAGLNHLLSCPAASFAGFLVTRDQQPCGYFVLAKIYGQTRIADIRLNRDDPKSWEAMCALAANVASDDSSTCEIAAGASLPWIQDAWLRAGLMQRQTDRIWCYDPRNLIPGGLPLELNLADGDMCFLTDPLHPYLS